MLDSKYEILRRLGAGGMGELYEARNRVIGRRVAIKFLASKYSEREDLLLRFENEARAAGPLAHENIVAVQDSGRTSDGARYIVMEMLEGEDFDRLLRRHSRLPPERAADLVIQACRGLAVAHASGIVHRDLKPANLFLTRRADGGDLVKILDFGIAKLQTGRSDPATTPGSIIGTPAYMSPEQARGSSALDHRTDLYSLGAILYELLSGRRPHAGTSDLEIIYRVSTLPPAPLAEVCPDLSPELARVVGKAMAFDMEWRFPSASAFADALLRFVAQGSSDVGTTSSAASTRTSVPSRPPGSDFAGSSRPPTTNSPIVPPVIRARTPRPSRHRLIAFVIATLAVAIAVEISRERLQALSPAASSSGPTMAASGMTTPAPAPIPASPAPGAAVERERGVASPSPASVKAAPAAGAGRRRSPASNGSGDPEDEPQASMDPAEARALEPVEPAAPVPSVAVPAPATPATASAAPAPSGTTQSLGVDKNNPYR